MEQSFVMVPIHVDVLHIDTPTLVADAMANFSRLPYVNTSAGDTADWNADTAYTSEDLLSPPFQNQTLVLESGVHLHWALPQALTRSHPVRKDHHDITFPAVPNRWLISRSGKQDCSWLVESDYLYPSDEGAEFGGVCYPVFKGSAQNGPPFRYMGRTLEMSEPYPSAATDYLKRLTGYPLTAVGYGEPTFAAFYPNSRGVFGLHDPVSPDLATTTVYHVFGWYADGVDDFCGTYAFQAMCQAGDIPAVQKALQDAYGWTVPDNIPNDTPLHMLCYACVELGAPPGDRKPPTSSMESGLKVALGNTATEALSAYLAQKSNASDLDRRQCEDQLESLHLMSDLEHLQLDLSIKFREARHAKGFRSTAGGTIWSIHVHHEQIAQSGATQAEEEVTLPKDLAHLLNRLNLAQQEYDKAIFQIASWRQRIFADWYKYMLSAYPPGNQRSEYPPVDEVKFFILDQDLRALCELEARAGVHPLTSQHSTLLDEPTLAGPSLAEQLDYWRNQLNDALATQPALRLRKLAGPRYWQPNEPVVLLTGEDVKPTGRRAQANKLPCTIVTLDAGAFAPERLDGLCKRLQGELVTLFAARDAALQEQIGQLTQRLKGLPTGAGETDEAQALRSQIADLAEQGIAGLIPTNGQPWNPLLLEWEVEFHPVGGPQSNLDHADRAYHSDFITQAFQLGEAAVDLTPTKLNETAARSIYHGHSILTPRARLELSQQTNAYLEKQLLAAYQRDHPDIPQSHDYFQQHRADIITWYRNLPLEKQDKFVDFVLGIEATIGSSFHALAQSLSGFNAALLGYQQTMQLGIADPLSFADQPLANEHASALPRQAPLSDYQTFAAIVKKAVGKHNRVAPQPQNDFHPIRTGFLQLARLRLVDSFGRPRDLTAAELASVAVADTLRAPATGSSEADRARIVLPPRLAQPARLNLRWLANGYALGPPAASTQGDQTQDGLTPDDLEMNSHPATSPICGWLLPNNLDNSIMVYNEAGQALGYLDRNSAWKTAPGSQAGASATEKIANPHLRRVVQWAEAKGESLMTDFIQVLDSALENIDPENWAQHLDLALLMGRPLAVVRATVNLELHGLPAINQDWTLFLQALQAGQRQAQDTDRIESVFFPVRLGEYRQLNDGLAGYWLETNAGELQQFFCSPQSTRVDSPAILTHIEPVQLPDSWQKAAAQLGFTIQTTADLSPSLMAQVLRHAPQALYQLTGPLVQAFTPEQAGALPPDYVAALGETTVARVNKGHLPPLHVSLDQADIRVMMLVDPRGKVHATSGILPTKAISLPLDQYAPALQKIEISFLTAPILTLRPSAADGLAINLPLPPEPGYTWYWVERRLDNLAGETWREADAIKPVDRQASFNGAQQLREGWLVLRKTIDTVQPQAAQQRETSSPNGAEQPDDRAKLSNRGENR